MLYIKELDNVNEVLKNNKLPTLFKKIMLIFRKIFGVVTINENGLCILPYKELEKFQKIKVFLIKKILRKLKCQIVLSNYLSNFKSLKETVSDLNLNLIEGRKIEIYLLDKVIEYICKVKKDEIMKQEITILIENQTDDVMRKITDLARIVKRIQIVTSKIENFRKFENELEENLGIACQISNNKKKSLSKAKIIINIDFNEDMLNSFNINNDAIIVEVNNKASVKSKLFSGINIFDYQIIYDCKNNMISNQEYRKFNKKALYEAKINGKNYDEVMQCIGEDNVRIVNLIGKNGVINCKELQGSM